MEPPKEPAIQQQGAAKPAQRAKRKWRGSKQQQQHRRSYKNQPKRTGANTTELGFFGSVPSFQDLERANRKGTANYYGKRQQQNGRRPLRCRHRGRGAPPAPRPSNLPAPHTASFSTGHRSGGNRSGGGGGGRAAKGGPTPRTVPPAPVATRFVAPGAPAAPCLFPAAPFPRRGSVSQPPSVSTLPAPFPPLPQAPTPWTRR